MSAVPVGPFYGALYFSAVLSVGFYGVTCMQTFFYYIHYQDDRLQTKALVASIWSLNTIHEALIISGVYKYLMAGLVNPLSIFTVVQDLITLILVPTQGFFVYRIYIFSGQNIIGPLIWFPLGLWELISTILYMSRAAYANVETLEAPYLTGIGISLYVVAVAVDIVIAICLTYLLARRRIAHGFKSSARILQLLTVFAINSGVWTATFALLTIVLLRALPVQLTYNVFGFPLCSIYCNTLLANLNARSYIKNQSTGINAGADLITDTHGSSTKVNASASGQGAELRFFQSTHRTKETENSEFVPLTETSNPVHSTTAPAL